MSIEQIDPDVLALLSALIAIDLAKGMDIDEQNIFGNFIIAVGSILVTIAAAEEAQKKAQEEAKAKEAKAKVEETKKAGTEGGEKTTAKPKEVKDSTGELPGRAEYDSLRSEQETLLRRLAALEQLVKAHVGPAK